MMGIDPASAAAVQAELASGENIMWAGQPNRSIIFHRADAFLIPFSLLWGGFALFWEAGVSGLWGHNTSGPLLIGVLWGIPFVVIGQYLIWGRFVYAGWLKRRTHYAVTNRRVLVIQNGLKREVASAYIDTLPSLNKDGGSNGVGTLRCGEPQGVWPNNRGFGVWNPYSVVGLPKFVDIDDVDSVYRLVSDLRERARSTKSVT